MSWLSGLPTEARKRRFLLALQIYVDDSGTEGTHPVVSLAGFFGQAEKWAEFSDEWRAWADRAPAIRYLKMKEAVKLRGEFGRFRAVERDWKLKGFMRIIRQFADKAIYATVDVSALHARPEIRDNVLGRSYWGMFLAILAGVCDELIEAKTYPLEPFEIIFDRQVNYEPKIRIWYPCLRRLYIESIDPVAEKLLPNEVLFRDDKEFLPLQAADVIAWHFRMLKEGQSSQFEWVANSLAGIIPVSRFSKHFDGESLQRILEAKREIEKGPNSARLSAYMDEISLDLFKRARKSAEKKARKRKPV
jgi:hypothetical protein